MTPTNIALHKVSRELELTWPDGSSDRLSCEFLRVYSPSAEVTGHGPGEEKLQLGKEDINITEIEPVGHYAIKIAFDDNHDSGIYDWNLLKDYANNKEQYWQDYLARCDAAGYTRKKEGQVI